MNRTMSASKISDRTLPAWYFHNPIRRLLRKPGLLLDSYGPSTGDVVADLGAGGGFFLTELSRRIGPSGRIYAVDVDAAALDVARGVSGSPGLSIPIEFVHGSAASASRIPSGGVDYVLSHGLLCCLVEKERAFEEMWRILKPGGRALVTFVTIGPRFTTRGRAVQMTDERFRELVGRRPWQVSLLRKGLLARRYALTKAG